MRLACCLPCTWQREGNSEVKCCSPQQSSRAGVVQGGGTTLEHWLTAFNAPFNSTVVAGAVMEAVVVEMVVVADSWGAALSFTLRQSSRTICVNLLLILFSAHTWHQVCCWLAELRRSLRSLPWFELPLAYCPTY